MTILRQDFIQSSMLSIAEYNTETEELTITFTGGKQYHYIDVPRPIYYDLISAPSAGRYFNSIKAGFKQKVVA